MFNRTPYKKIKKDYQRKNLKNPFFHQKTPEKYYSIWRYFIIGMILLFIFLFWFFLAAPFWNLKKVQISGLTRTTNIDLEKTVWDQTASTSWLFFRQSNIFMFDEEGAANTILSSYNFAGVEVEKKWPNTINIKVSERPYSFIFQEGTQLNYASADAYLIKEPPVNEDDKKKYFILENKNSLSLISDRDKINITTTYLDFIKNLYNLLIIYPELPVERFIIDQEFNTIKVKFSNGPLVYFNVKDAAAKQVELLLLVKKEKIKDNFSKTNYIDLRYGDRIFINPEFK